MDHDTKQGSTGRAAVSDAEERVLVRFLVRYVFGVARSHPAPHRKGIQHAVEGEIMHIAIAVSTGILFLLLIGIGFGNWPIAIGAGLFFAVTNYLMFKQQENEK